MQNAIIYASLHYEKATNENRKPETEIIAIFTYIVTSSHFERP